MNLQDIRYIHSFIAVAEELSVSRAARRLNLSQPPLTQQIQRLERSLNVKLFERVSKGMRLTNAGHVLLARSYDLLADAEGISAEVKAAHDGQIGTLTVGCVPAGFAGLVPTLIRQFREPYPNVTLKVHEADTRKQYALVETMQLDLGLVRNRIKAPTLEHKTVCDEPLLIALPEDHQLATVSHLMLADLRDEEFIFFSRNIGRWYFDNLMQICQQVGKFSPSVAQECDTVLSQLGMVASGVGIALVPEMTSSLKLPRLTYRVLSDVDITIPLFAIWPREKRNPIRDNFLALENWWEL